MKADDQITRSIEDLGESFVVLTERWALRGTRGDVLEAAKAALTDAAWVVFTLAPEYGLAADRMLLREISRALDVGDERAYIRGIDARLDVALDRIDEQIGKHDKRGGSL